MIPWIYADLDTIIDCYSEPPKGGMSMSFEEYKHEIEAMLLEAIAKTVAKSAGSTG